jgi:predicted component of type VI protein secretion system
VVLGDSTLIGRGTDCDYILDDTQASRSHALIEKGEEGFTLTDQDSSNGTFVDDERIYGPVLLSEGDTILIGQTTFTFEQLDEVEDEIEEAVDQAAPPEPVVAEPDEPAPSAEAVPPAEPQMPVEAPAEPVRAQAPAGKICPSCGAALEPGIAFCGECGHQLAGAPAAGGVQAAAPDWDPIDSMEPQPIDPKRPYFSRKGLRIGCLVLVGLALALTCFLYVLDYLVGLLM